MKKFILLASLLLSNMVFANDLPECTDDSTGGCVFPVDLARRATMDMMLENFEGMKLVKQTGENGLMLSFFDAPNEIKVTLVDEVQNGDIYTTRIKFELNLSDCRGTDACGWDYLWTVEATVTTDGYVSNTVYKNTITEK